MLVAVMGPTASGKTTLAERLADWLDASLVNADAFQIFRGFDIGTAKPKNKGRYELLDLKGPGEDFGVGEWVLLSEKLLQGLWKKSKSGVVVGGTGLYVRALFEQYQELMPAPDERLRKSLMERERTQGKEALARELQEVAPEVAKNTDLRNPVRVRRALERIQSSKPPIKVELPPFTKVKIALDPEPELLDKAIARRVDELIEGGWVNEVARLAREGVGLDAPAMRAIGYETLAEHLQGLHSLEKARAKIVVETRQYAKRQRTWLRSEPGVHWIRLHGSTDEAFDAAKKQILSVF